MKDKSFISILIPTLERHQSVNELANQLLKQQYPNFEIIIVDQSREKNQPLIDLQKENQKIKYFKIEKTGTCLAKNFGLKKASGEIIIFMDDDCRVENPDFIQNHVSNYEDSKIGGVGGRLIDKNVRLNRETTGPVCRVSKTGCVFPNANSDVKQEINAPRGGNMSFRKSVIFEVGGFDERLIGNAMREETDFSLRVVEAGYKIIFEPKADNIHLALAGGTRSLDRIKWYFDFFHNEMLFFLKHFPKIYLPILFFRKLRPILVCMFYYGKAKPRALVTPFLGFRSGYKAYLKKETKWL
jgi:GT2 family glycosyltransferase